MREPIFAANWKMHKTVTETRDYFQIFLPLIEGIKKKRVIIAPPFTALSYAKKAASDNPRISISAQNMHYENEGAFTGEISPVMLNELGISHVIIGHSERRHVFNEDDGVISMKIEAAIVHGISPIFCIGETLSEREKKLTFAVLEKQISKGLSRTKKDKMGSLVIAYEPVWAIGTGVTATPGQAQDAHEFVRSSIHKLFNSSIANDIRILYGGSVKPENIKELMQQPDIDGVLVGGASLNPESFAKIANYELN